MNLNYKQYGEGEPVIILHGLLGMLDNWHSFAKSLSQNYWVISVDQRNHGKSFHSEDFNYKLLSKDLLALLKHLDINKCHQIGHSMGGKTVMQFVKDHPQMVAKAVVVDIAPRTYTGNHNEIFNALLNIDLRQPSSRKEVQEELMNELGEMSIVLFLMKNLNRHTDGSYSWKANIPALYNNYQNIINGIEITKPVKNEVLFVKGGNSKYISNKDSDDISKMFLHSNLITIENAGHWVHAEKADELLTVINEFLAD